MTTPAPAPASEPREVVIETERRPDRPGVVWLVALVGFAVTAVGLVALAQARPEPPVLLVGLAALLALYGYTHVALVRGQGWARALVVAVSIGAICLSLVAIAVSAGDGKLGAEWRLPVLVLVVESAVLAALLVRGVRVFFTDVAWRESLVDVKWAVALLFLVMLALFGANNAAWAKEPEGREDVPRLVDLLLSPEPGGLGGELPLMLLLQLLGVLLVAGLIAAVVIAMREPESDAEALDDHTEAR